jgi:hypothetical protein
LSKRIEENFLNQVPFKKINFVKQLFTKLENKINIIQVSAFHSLLNRLRNKKKITTSKKNIFSPPSKSKSSLSFIEDNKNNNTLTTYELNDLKDFEECTFKPKVNRNRKIKRTKNIYDKLYCDSKVYTDKKVNQTMNHFIKESEDITFIPKVNSKFDDDSRDDFLKTIEKVNIINIV